MIDWVIQPQYGGQGTQFSENNIPTCSLPFVVEDALSGTASTAAVLEDNESQTATDFIQGRNSWTSIQGGEQSAELSSYYGGMTPPDQPHIYKLHVYALDRLPVLRRGFLLNELYREMDGHILAEYTKSHI